MILIVSINHHIIIVIFKQQIEMSYFLYLQQPNGPMATPHPIFYPPPLFIPAILTQETSFPDQIHLRHMPQVLDPQIIFNHPYLPSAIDTNNNAQPIKSVSIRHNKHRSKFSSKHIKGEQKNNESHIIKQLFSNLLQRHLSQSVVKKAMLKLKMDENRQALIREAFYRILSFIVLSKGRKYVNSKLLVTLFCTKTFIRYFSDMSSYFSMNNQQDLKDICQLFRMCAYHFVRQISPLAILTSKRIQSSTCLQHIKILNQIATTMIKRSFK